VAVVGLPLATMVRIHCLQQWYGLSDPAMEEELYEIASMRQFAGLSLARGTVPDEATILNFRHLLEQHGLAREIFDAVKAPAGGGVTAATRHDRRCDDHLGSEFDEEQHGRTRPGDAPDPEGEPVVA
jgi:IS5 family transposase